MRFFCRCSTRRIALTWRRDDDHPVLRQAVDAAGANISAAAHGASTCRWTCKAAPPSSNRCGSALLAIPRGGTTSYGVARPRIGKPAAVRAVGAAVGRNPISIIVPCHRVLGADGSLTGYAGGLERKTALLQLEGAL